MAAAMLAVAAAATGCTSLVGVDPDAGDATLDAEAAVDDLADVESALADGDGDGDDGASVACGAAQGGCNIITNEGCEEGSRCGFFSGVDSGSLCVPEGTAGIGDRCVSISTCRRGLACLNGRCYRLCCPTFHERCAMDVDGGRPSRCALGLEGNSALRTCTIPCDPYRQDCRDGMNCVPPERNVPPTCVQAGTRGIGARCTGSVGQCVVGGICALTATDAGEVGLCRQICNPGKACADGGVCEFLAAGIGGCAL